VLPCWASTERMTETCSPCNSHLVYTLKPLLCIGVAFVLDKRPIRYGQATNLGNRNIVHCSSNQKDGERGKVSLSSTPVESQHGYIPYDAAVYDPQWYYWPHPYQVMYSPYLSYVPVVYQAPFYDEYLDYVDYVDPYAGYYDVYDAYGESF